MVHREGTVRRIFVFFGGSDTTNETAKTLHAIKNLATRRLSIDVVVGALNPFKHEVEKLCSEMPNTKYYCAPVNMFEFMAKADLAIGAGGITTWERCCMGLPSIVISIAPNQDSSIIEMAEDGRLIFLGQSNSVNMEYLRASIEHLINNPSLCRFLGRASKDLVDGCGLERVINVLLPGQIFLRPATYEDCENIFSWRQHNQTRRFSFNKELISFQEHQNWFLKAIENPDKMIFIGEIRGEPIGVLRYDVEGEGAAVSIYLVPGKYGSGYGPLMLKEGNKWLKRQRPELKFVYAHIIPDNIASIKAFAKAGFKHDCSIYKRDLYDETNAS
jgi:RimJ/RimL family protein N-acetyltransferase